jgi:hypothetical protein
MCTSVLWRRGRGGEVLGCLKIDRSPKTPLIDVEPERGEDLER